ncbi:MFS allantoate transporter [Coleophoma cylindrospora]|uniref:MFS allantoate transporter n=1 Tax=Coleophoma cylindrospora TaxID=1849047 RepID=A0A3D8QLQ2_9HELO|nr:MFS allantoate transporter [Coleophoma cylindrospora]
MADKPTGEHVEGNIESSKEFMEEIAKHETVNGDIGMNMFEDFHDLAATIDPKAEARLVRKIDMYIIPFICITYLVTYIDKATLGYAAIFGLSKDVGLHGTQYSWLGSIFYFGYMFFEYPTSYAMQRWSVAKWLSINVFIWGGVCMALGGCNNFEALAALRFILGMLESCSTPAYLLLTSMWYKVEEQPIRIGYWSTFLGLANSFGGLLAYGIGNIKNGALDTWRYQFIIVGAVSAAWGFLMFFFLAESPVSASWLSKSEKKMAVERLRGNQTGVKNITFKTYQLVEALTDPKTWFLFMFGVSTQVVNGAVSNFGSLIIKGFGYSSLVTTLLQIPYGAIIIVAVLSAMYLQRWLPGQKRCVVAGLYVLPALAGVAGLTALPTTHRHARLACYYLTALYTASFAMCMSLVTANVGGSTKRTTVNALFFISYCAGNIIGPFAFKSNEAPTYRSGIIAVLVGYCVEIVVLVLFAVYLAWCNKKKEQHLVDTGKVNASYEEQAVTAFRDLTDIENPFFRYTY